MKAVLKDFTVWIWLVYTMIYHAIEVLTHVYRTGNWFWLVIPIGGFIAASRIWDIYKFIKSITLIHVTENQKEEILKRNPVEASDSEPDDQDDTDS